MNSVAKHFWIFSLGALAFMLFNWPIMELESRDIYGGVQYNVWFGLMCGALGASTNSILWLYFEARKEAVTLNLTMITGEDGRDDKKCGNS